MERLDTPVLIAGAGPVGLLAALELAHHGVGCILIDRSREATKFPKMDITNGRSMELFRRLGIADAVREAGVASIPVSALFEGDGPQHILRLCFAKDSAILDEAVARLAAFRDALRSP